ncbi:gas vesicle protein GvpF [Salipaludibacillus neizhouensis]|uniref:Gas vesicle protein GvpF n=1 Tax=Salipaludibacillus neizhouensis TaxID=885475 RepID=A0A3A9K702_9BACI|nr:GvpL/GvpF family gas vesicle protein [Salipaludibacillus neizhouensis]RKL66292.1 gas vesicle protein GvpF [Salipaludibacillus neizhouensis]
MSKDTGVYLFAVVKAETVGDLESVTLAGEEREIFFVPYKNQVMVVAEAPVQIYEPNRENLKSHQQVVAELMKRTTVIPMSFGNVLETEKDALILLERLYEKFESIFPKIENKIEVGLKIIGKKEWMTEQAGQQADLAKMKQSFQGKKDEATHYDKIRIGEAAQKFVKGIHFEFEEEVFQPLAKIADAAKSNEVIGERMLLNASFLVDRSKEEEFDKQVDEFHDKWKDRADFKYTGPWPAYNFIDVKIKAEDAS